jgi:hypothetical protein
MFAQRLNRPSRTAPQLVGLREACQHQRVVGETIARARGGRRGARLIIGGSTPAGASAFLELRLQASGATMSSAMKPSMASKASVPGSRDSAAAPAPPVSQHGETVAVRMAPGSMSTSSASAAMIRAACRSSKAECRPVAERGASAAHGAPSSPSDAYAKPTRAVVLLEQPGHQVRGRVVVEIRR